MSEQLYTMAGTKVFISQNPVNSKAEVEASDFAGTSWVEIKGLYSVGELGGDQTINEFEAISEEWMRKAKSTRNGGTMTNQFIPMALDPGQIKLQEAIEECRPYQFKVERGADCAPESEVTITIASPGVITWNNHGLSAGQPIVFSTTGSLPTGLTAGTVYYVAASPVPDANTFSVAATVGGTAIITSSTQSGVHTATAPPAGMTDLFQGYATDGTRSGGAKNDLYLRTWSIAVDGRILTV